MSSRKERLKTICRIIRAETICNQEELLKRLETHGYSITQATLSRDIKQLKIARVHDENENYVYRLTDSSIQRKPTVEEASGSHANIEFSGNLAILRTRPGYAMAIAYDIDTNMPREILATVAGDDTILIIPREGYDRESIAAAIEQFIQ